MLRILTLSLVAVGLAAAALAAATDEKAKDPRICRASPETGTRISSSECHLRSEWVAIDEARHRQYEELNKQIDAPGILSPQSNSPYPH